MGMGVLASADGGWLEMGIQRWLGLLDGLRLLARGDGLEGVRIGVRYWFNKSRRGLMRAGVTTKKIKSTKDFGQVFGVDGTLEGFSRQWVLKLWKGIWC